jgi:hypothetical protein
VLRDFITERGKILPRRITGTCSFHQKKLATEIKRARIMALFPSPCTIKDMPLMGEDRRTLWIIMGAFFISLCLDRHCNRVSLACCNDLSGNILSLRRTGTVKMAGTRCVRPPLAFTLSGIFIRVHDICSSSGISPCHAFFP